MQRLPRVAQLDDPDLGARMTAALAWALAQGASKVCCSLAATLFVKHRVTRVQACVIGTDIPELSQPNLEEAVRLLDEFEVRSLLLRVCSLTWILTTCVGGAGPCGGRRLLPGRSQQSRAGDDAGAACCRCQLPFAGCSLTPARAGHLLEP